MCYVYKKASITSPKCVHSCGSASQGRGADIVEKQLRSLLQSAPHTSGSTSREVAAEAGGSLKHLINRRGAGVDTHALQRQFGQAAWGPGGARAFRSAAPAAWYPSPPRLTSVPRNPDGLLRIHRYLLLEFWCTASDRNPCRQR